MVLVETSSSLPWNILRRNLKLINDNVAMVNPNDMAYVSAGIIFLYFVVFVLNVSPLSL